jgi:WD40 repeat protein
VRLWDAHTGEPVRTLAGHKSGVGAVAFSPAGTTVASGSGDGTVRLWDARTGELADSLPVRSAVRALAWHEGSLIIGCQGGLVLVWYAKGGEHSDIRAVALGEASPKSQPTSRS